MANRNLSLKRHQVILYTLPAILFIGIFMLYPIFYSFWISLTKFDGAHTPEFIGLKNYIKMFASDEFKAVLLNNLYYFVLAIPASILVPLVLAVFLYNEPPGHRVFKVLLLIPSVLSVTVVGILFRTVFGSDGPVLGIWEAITGSKINSLFASGVTAIPIIVLAMVWVHVGLNCLIYLTGMNSIPGEIYEASRLDGFNWFQQLFYITIPMIKPVMQYVAVMSVINLFSSMFGYIFTMTNGGPGYQSSVLEYLIYVKGFYQFDFGYASAISTVLFVIIMVISSVFMRIFSTEED